MNRTEPEGATVEPSRRPILDVLEANRAQLHARPGVAGVAVGSGHMGEEAILLFVTGNAVDLPEEIEGYPVRAVTTGTIEAL